MNKKISFAIIISLVTLLSVNAQNSKPAKVATSIKSVKHLSSTIDLLRKSYK